MRCELTASERRRTVGNPDTLPIEIQVAQRRANDGFLRTSAAKKRPVQDGHFRMPGRIGNSNREHAGVLVVHAVEFNALIRAEAREPYALPVEEVLRCGQGDSRAAG